MEEQMMTKKVIKKDIRRIGWSLILYMVVNYAVVLGDMSWKVARIMSKTSDEVLQEQQIEALAEGAGSMIIGVLLGLGVLYLIAAKRIRVGEMFAEKKKMTSKTFICLLCVFMAAQLCGSLFYAFMEVGLNMIGYTAETSMETATEYSNTLSMFLYASFIGPIVEELVYRGFAAQSLRKYGKVFAIVISAILFGVMHANLPQAVFAFGVGLVLGYVTIEYSLKWAILIHVINNFVFADLIGIIGKILGEPMQLLLNAQLIYGFFFVGMAILVKKRKEIREYIKENRTEGKVYRYALTVLPIVIFIGVSLFLGFFMLEPMV